MTYWAWKLFLVFVIILQCNKSALSQECDDEKQPTVINNYCSYPADDVSTHGSQQQLQGRPGKRGGKGDKGDQGPQGTQGIKGNQGAVGRSFDDSVIQELNEKINLMQADFNQRLLKVEKYKERKDITQGNCPHLLCGDMHGGSEHYQRDVASVEECMQICYQQKRTNPAINGITVTKHGRGRCYCETNGSSRRSGCSYQSCYLP